MLNDQIFIQKITKCNKYANRQQIIRFILHNSSWYILEIYIIHEVHNIVENVLQFIELKAYRNMIGSRLLTAYYTFTLALKTCKFVTKIWTIFSGFRLLNYLAIVTTLKRQYKCTSSRKLIFFSIVKTNSSVL